MKTVHINFKRKHTDKQASKVTEIKFDKCILRNDIIICKVKLFYDIFKNHINNCYNMFIAYYKAKTIVQFYI